MNFRNDRSTDILSVGQPGVSLEDFLENDQDHEHEYE